MINVYVNLNGKKGEFIGSYDSESEALESLTEARNDNDYSRDTFKDCYKVEEVD